MSIQELLKQSGLEYHRKDGFKLGLIIMGAAKKKKVKWTKKMEMIEVNDFPEEFVPEMQELLIQYFSQKTKTNEKV